LRSLYLNIVSVNDDDYDESYLLQLGFHPVAVVGSLFTIIRKRQHKKRNNTHNNKKHRIYKIDNKNTKQKTNIKILKNTSRVIRK